MKSRLITNLSIPPSKLAVALTTVLALGSSPAAAASGGPDKTQDKDWVIGPFVRPEGMNPVIMPEPTAFHCPMRKEQVK